MTFPYLTRLRQLPLLGALLELISTPSDVTIVRHDESGNSGMCIINGSAAHLPRRTILVLGQERGGTSMVAGALDLLGIYMGNTLSPAVHEDHELGHFLKVDDRVRARQLIRARDSEHDTWGLKKPTLRLLTRRWQKLFREPVYVVVFRDILAIANRRRVSRGHDLISAMYESLDQFHRLIDFARATRRPTLMVSYEKALNDPEAFVRALAEFLGIEDEERQAKAAAFIRPSPDSYLRVTRVPEGWLGWVERVGSTRVEGWAFRKGQVDPVTVILTLPGGIELKRLADQPRQDVRDYHRHPSVAVGFGFDLAGEHCLQDGDCIQVHIEGEETGLNNSPFVLKRNQ